MFSVTQNEKYVYFLNTSYGGTYHKIYEKSVVMESTRVKSNELSTEKFLDGVFMITSISLLFMVFIEDEKNVWGYYQDLLIVSFSMISTILHICCEISDNKNRNLYPPKFIDCSYRLSRGLIAICCAVSMVVLFAVNRISLLNDHMVNNSYVCLCLITFIPIVYSGFWGYIYPLFKEIPYENGSIARIRYENRENS